MTDQAAAQKKLFFNAAHLPDDAEAYVVWVDVMGIRAAMLRSLRVTANFVFKLHIALLEAKPDGVELYPVMDGAYVVSNDDGILRTFLASVFRRLAENFIAEEQPEHQFLTKASVAFGPVIHGRDIPGKACWTLEKNTQCRNAVLLGMPMVLAVGTERLAPPFGVYIDHSASRFLTTQERKCSSVWWTWFQRGDKDRVALELQTSLEKYFDWCSARAGAIDYDPSRIRAHRDSAAQYLVNA